MVPGMQQMLDKYWRMKFKKEREGFPGGPVVKNLAANAGDKGSIPDLGQSHMLLSLCSRAGETRLLSPYAASEAHAPYSLHSTREAMTMRSLHIATKGSPRSPQLEKSPRRNKDPAQPKLNKWIKLLLKKSERERNKPKRG